MDLREVGQDSLASLGCRLSVSTGKDTTDNLSFADGIGLGRHTPFDVEDGVGGGELSSKDLNPSWSFREGLD